MKNLYIFDLDGTLYEGTDHFDYYAELLMQDVSANKRESFWRDYEQMKEGNHPVAIGKAYDVENDLAVTVDPLTLKAVAVHKWNGEKVEKHESIYGDEQLVFDFKKLVAIGDGWWLPFASAKHYGVEDCHPRYLQTKEYMVGEKFTLEAIPGLREFLLALRERHDIVLMTNSDREDVLRLLDELGLTGVFDHVITSAQKPARTKAFFEELQTIYKVPFSQMISVGDNFINEIAPALLLGMKAVYISEHPHQTQHKDLYHVNKISDWTNEMKLL